MADAIALEVVATEQPGTGCFAFGTLADGVFELGLLPVAWRVLVAAIELGVLVAALVGPADDMPEPATCVLAVILPVLVGIAEGVAKTGETGTELTVLAFLDVTILVASETVTEIFGGQVSFVSDV
jgi:hypothetical protein